MNKLLRNFCCLGSKYVLPEDNHRKTENMVRIQADKVVDNVCNVEDSPQSSVSNKRRRWKDKDKNAEEDKMDNLLCDNKDQKEGKTTEITTDTEKLKPSAGNFTAAGRAAGLKLVDHSQNPSSSCPQLTVEEPTSTTSSIDDENGKASDQVQVVRELNRVEEEVLPSQARQSQQQKHQENRSLLTKTYSFKRMLSFRGSFRSRDSGESISPTNFRRDNDPLFEESQYRPLQFSFLGQIYAKKSLKKQYRRHSSSLRWPRGTNPTSGMTITTNPLVPDMDLPSTDQKRFAVFAIETEEEEDEIVNK